MFIVDNSLILMRHNYVTILSNVFFRIPVFSDQGVSFWAVSFCISEETEALGFAVESLVHDHELLGWFNANMIHAYWELMSLWNL